MLSKDQAISDIDFRRGIVLPDRLTRQRHASYVERARRMITVYQNGEGKSRKQLHRHVERILSKEADCPTKRVAAFCKLLDEIADYDQGSPVSAARLRRTVFRMAAKQHPLVESADGLFGSERNSTREQIASELGKSWEEIEQKLFADVIENHRLKSFPADYEPNRLLARYNVAQTQAALYDAVKLTIWSETQAKSILKYAKLAGLMHSMIRQPSGGYCIQLDGPASVVQETKRYGVSFAKFLPGLMSCDEWKLSAELRVKRFRRPLRLSLSSLDGLNCDATEACEFDSQLEAEFTEKWGVGRRDGWLLQRDGKLLHEGQHVFSPDFTLQHEDGHEVCCEIVGYWTSEYLEEKRKTLQRFSSNPIVVAIPKASASLRSLADSLPSNIRFVFFKRVLKPQDVVAAANAIRAVIPH